MLDDLLLRGLLAGCAIALLCGPLGCFVVWRRMAYFGDTLANSALLGVVLGLLLGLDTGLGVIAVCLLTALALHGLQKDGRWAGDTLLGIFAHAALAVGLVAISLLEEVRVDLLGYLFGDILALQSDDVWWTLGGALAGGVALLRLWRPLLAVTVHADLAAAEGVAVARVQLGFMLLMALVIAVGMKVVGILLITAMLVVPAAAARAVSRTPERMGLVAMAIGLLAVLAGFAGAYHWDLPAGPSIVTAASLLFVAMLPLRLAVRP